jgi:hypothetical protein
VVTGLVAAMAVLLWPLPARAVLRLTGAAGVESGEAESEFDLAARLALPARLPGNSALELAARWHDRQLRAYAAGTRARSGLWAAGEIEIQWGAGCLLRAARVFSPLRLGSFRGTGGGPFHLRGTTAWRAQSCRGGACRIPLGFLDLAGWAGRWDRGPWQGGLGLWRNGLGLMIGGFAHDGVHVGCWSLCWTPRSPAPRAALLLEAAGGAPWALHPGGAVARRKTTLTALAASWRTPDSAVLGSLTGDLHWGGETHTPTACGQATGSWQLDWALPPMRGVRPTLMLLVNRRATARDPVARLERSLRLSLQTAPWSGAQLRLALGRRREEGCRSQPDENGQRAMIAARQSLIDLRARFELSPALSATLRFRESQSALTLDEEGSPTGLPGAGTGMWETDSEESTSLWWDRGAGSLSRLALDYRPAGRWSGGLALAAAPGARAAAVSIRSGPGRRQWRMLAAGAWLAEAWLGRKLGMGTCEGGLRLHGGAGRPLGAQLTLGLRMTI